MQFLPIINTKSKILNSARDLYVQEGLKELTMRKVAKRAGMSTMAAYRHFENKEDLIQHVILEGFRIFQTYFYRALEGENPQERMLMSSESYLRFALENPRYYEAMFMPVVRIREIQFHENGKKQMKAALQFLMDRIRECVEAGLISTDHPKELALSLWAHAHGLVSLYFAGRFEEQMDFQKFYSRSINRFLKGLGFPD